MREVRRADERFHTRGAGVTTWHSFSYGTHYDPDNVGFGPLVAINVERVEPGAGYDTHRHTDVEIVTWVLEGRLEHEDSTGHGGVVRPGTAQRLSAGTGVEHAERNESGTEPLVFVQMMLASDHVDAPAYAQVDVELGEGELVPTVDVAAPAELFLVRLRAGQSVTVPATPRSLAHVTSGSVALGDTTLACGDEARLLDDGAYDLSAAGEGGDVLVWQLQR